MVIASTATYPVGNFYAKKALNHVSPSTILFVRFFIGGLFILSLAMIADTGPGLINIVFNDWRMLLFTGLILLGAGKIVWYEALRRLDISKAISLGMTFPLFSLILLIGIFKVAVSRYQWIGIVIMMLGVFISVRRSSVDPALTRYAPD
jgi:drug/metabolite transporter (DMT)-like permease